MKKSLIVFLSIGVTAGVIYFAVNKTNPPASPVVSAKVVVSSPPISLIVPTPTVVPTPAPKVKLKAALKAIPATPPASISNTMGSQMPVIYDEWWLRSGDKYAIVSGPSLMENAAFRTNLIFTWQGQVTFDIDLYSDKGIKLGSLSYNTDSFPCSTKVCSGYFQRDRLMRDINSNYEGIFTIRCTLTSGTGKVFFFATSIDNKSGDPTMYSQFRFAADGNVWSEGGLYYQGI